ncbi:MAG TPA: sialate O-acetylesterase, partial [Pirellulales bacterium]|nr:sialate O-acetylesterase [Pirellulales bacterium]
YFFGRELHRQLHVPIGLINSSVGGSIIEGWISRQSLDTLPELRESTAARVDHMQAQPDDIKRFPLQRQQWEERNGVRPPANEGVSRGWADPDFDDHGWKQAAFPARWSQAAAVDRGGVFWLRKEVTFPASLAGKPFRAVFNFMHDQYDTAYFNGVEIGHAGDQPPLFVLSQRRYPVPGRLVKAGKNVIALRVVAPSERLDLLGRGAHGDYGLPLDRKQVGNVWRMKVESLFPPLSIQALQSRPRPNDAALQNTPVILFNGMIHPLMPLPIRGVIWYQGESNTSRPAEYRKLFPLLIEDWRRGWKQPDLPFYFVQLASFLPPPSDPNENSGWAELREAQAMTADKVPHTGMAVAIDVGEADNIHPIDKQSVGRRLALAALHQTYGRDIPYSGPRYESMQVDGDRIRIRFRHAEGLTAKGGSPKRFAIAGEDRKFVWADARIDGDSVVVSSPQVSHPVAVRYAWANNPEGANLYNAAGLPASPLRTDDW